MVPVTSVKVNGRFVNIEYVHKNGHAVTTKIDGHKIKPSRKKKPNGVPTKEK